MATDCGQVQLITSWRHNLERVWVCRYHFHSSPLLCGVEKKEEKIIVFARTPRVHVHTCNTVKTKTERKNAKATADTGTESICVIEVFEILGVLLCNSRGKKWDSRETERGIREDIQAFEKGPEGTYLTKNVEDIVACSECSVLR
jgi:hypothetical protein